MVESYSFTAGDYFRRLNSFLGNGRVEWSIADRQPRIFGPEVRDPQRRTIRIFYSQLDLLYAVEREAASRHEHAEHYSGQQQELGKDEISFRDFTKHTSHGDTSFLFFRDL